MTQASSPPYYDMSTFDQYPNRENDGSFEMVKSSGMVKTVAASYW